MEMTRNFGCTKEGNQASLYVIRNENGMEAAEIGRASCRERV